MPDRVAKKRYRQSLSCTSCARRKLRCSRSIPCSSCVDRGEEDSCCRDDTISVTDRDRPHRRQIRSYDRAIQQSTSLHDATSSTLNHEAELRARSPTTSMLSSGDCRSSHEPACPPIELDGATSPQPPSTSAVTDSSARIPHIRNTTVVALEFLSHGRQNILRVGGGLAQNNSAGGSILPAAQTGDSSMGTFPAREGLLPWETTFSTHQVRNLLALHETNFAWMHNVLHLPTFRHEFETLISLGVVDEAWTALCYAVLCVGHLLDALLERFQRLTIQQTTIYHGTEDQLRSLGISATIPLVRMLYNKSIQNLFEASFMSTHKLTNVQTICILVQVAHNLDQSDFITVLLATAIRICQYLDINRLGKDPPVAQNGDQETPVQWLIDREVKKRVWWFIVRQDWLQIPFQNTYLIHGSQFNTPRPLNCLEDVEEMIQDGKIVVQPDTKFTQSSYTNVLNEVAAIIWKHQDRTCAVGHPGRSQAGLLSLYEQVLWADQALKQNYRDMPPFFRHARSPEIGDPEFLDSLRSVHLLSMGHKTLTVHRHFQLPCFRDKLFAFTQQSCIAISQRCLLDVENWSSAPGTQVVMRMWTVITHIITCCINLLLASIFRDEGLLLYDGDEMQRLAKVGREAIRSVEDWSSIAKRGGRLLDVLFQLEETLDRSNHSHFSIERIVQLVSQVDTDFREGLALAPEQFFDPLSAFSNYGEGPNCDDTGEGFE